MDDCHLPAGKKWGEDWSFLLSLSHLTHLHIFRTCCGMLSRVIRCVCVRSATNVIGGCSSADQSSAGLNFCSVFVTQGVSVKMSEKCCISPQSPLTVVLLDVFPLSPRLFYKIIGYRACHFHKDTVDSSFSHIKMLFFFLFFLTQTPVE